MAQASLASFYCLGRGGLPEDDREAARLYKLAADQGNASAQSSLAHFYEIGRGGLPQDDREAARLYKLAADQGNASAQANLAKLYYHGLCGLPQNDREAARLYKLAADQGDASAQNFLGLFARLYELAAENALTQATLIGSGFGRFAPQGEALCPPHRLPQDYREAARLYERAADQRDAVTKEFVSRRGW